MVQNKIMEVQEEAVVDKPTHKEFIN